MALIPYQITEHTVFPMKTWEYLTALSALTAIDPPVEFAHDVREFAGAMDLAGRYSTSEHIAVAQKWTWDAFSDTLFASIRRPGRSQRMGSARQ